MAPIDITDPADSRVADFRGLNDASYRRRVETGGPFGGGFFVVEGWLAFERALAARHEIRSVLVLRHKIERALELLGGREPPVFVVAPEVCEQIVGFDLHRGIVASVSRRRPANPDTLVARSERLLVVEGVNDAENLGAIFRSAAALGADGVLLDPTTADPLSRRAGSRGPVGRSPVGSTATRPSPSPRRSTLSTCARSTSATGPWRSSSGRRDQGSAPRPEPSPSWRCGSP